jgi:hypothetical protein
MSVMPPMNTVGQDLYDDLVPVAWDDANQGWALANYCSAIGVILEEIALLVRADDEGNDGWSAFADPQRCPTSFLYTLAQWAGVRYPRRMSEADLRALIGPHAPGVWRGTKDAILASVKRYLSPDGALFFEERADGNAYHLRIFTYTYDTLDETAIRNELLNVVPAGLILDYEVRDGQSYDMVRARFQSYAELKATYATYADVTSDVPT